MKRILLKLFTILIFINVGRQCFAQEFKLNNELRHETVNNLSVLLKENYVLPDIGKKYANQIQNNLKKGKYNNISNPYGFAETLIIDIKEIQNDRHLKVRFSPQTVKNIRNSKKNEEENNKERKNKVLKEQKRNYGFREVKIMAGNIGYLKFNEFPSERAAETIISAMGFLQYTDAIIIDLRNNTGGNPEIVAFIGGYFFTEEYQTEFGSLFHRIKNKTFQYKTPLYLPGKRLVHTDLYILVGPNTFSAAEGFAYDLQHYGRAIIVGTKTKGGAHAANPFIINDYFVVDLPFAKPVNPVTKSNWEGTGVIPDIKCQANDALKKAQNVITEKIISNNSDKDFLNSFGYALIRENNLELAIEVFKKNIELHPDYANGYDSLGEAYMLNGNKELAIKNYKKSLELDPRNDNAKQQLIKLKNE